jgi:RHS repeat-associated protein
VSIAAGAPLGAQGIQVVTGTETVSLASAFTVGSGTPVITLVNPNTGPQGQTNLSVTITGQFTHFSASSVVTFSGTGITVGTPTAATLTSLTLPVSIAANAPLGAQGIQLVTGTETVSLANAFTVAVGAPVITLVNPNTGPQGQTNLSVTITGQFTHFSAASVVTFNGTGITVGTPTAATLTSLTLPVSIAATAPLGAQGIQVVTGTETVSLANAFTVGSGTPVITLVNPNTGQQGQTNLSVAITGQFTHWLQGTTTASFGAGITIAGLTINSATSATVLLNIDPAAVAGPRSVTLTTNAEVATLTNGFTVNLGTSGSGRIVVGHDVNTLSSSVAGPNEIQFAVNLANWLTGANSGNIFAVESSPGDETRDYAPSVKAALANAGFTVTYVSNPATVAGLTLADLQTYIAVFVGETYPTKASISSPVLTQYVNGGGNVYVYGGVGESPAVEAAFLNPFLQAFGLAFDTTTYNGLNSVNVTSTHPIFNGLTGKTLGSGNGQDIYNLGTNPNASIVQFQGPHGVYAVVNSASFGVPTIKSVSPNAGQQGQQNLSATITGQFTHFLQGSTTASFGAGITLASLTVTSPTGATAVLNIDPAAAVGPRNVTLTTNAEVVTLTNGFTVTAGTPVLLTVNPNAGQQGQTNLSVTITGQFTHFSASSVVTFSGSGITVGTPTAATLTSLTLPVSIAANATLGAQGIQVVTGTETVSLANAFTVAAGTPVITLVNPNTGQQGQTNLSVTITGQFTHFVPGTTSASFGAAISVTSLTVNSATSATAVLNIDPGAAVGTRNVTITTGTEIATLTNGFTVALINHPPQIISSPSTTRNWTQLSPGGTIPAARGTQDSNSQAYDETNDRMMFFGGEVSFATDPSAIVADVWVLANASGRGGPPSWNQTTPAVAGPVPRQEQSVIYAKSSNRLIIQGGTNPGGALHLSDTWVLTNANGLGGPSSWIRLPDLPSYRQSHATVYDPGTNRMIIFGGFGGGDLNDVWVLADADGIGSPSWTQLTPAGTPPLSREGAAAVYDQATNRLIVFGGFSRAGVSAPPYGNLNDVWVLTNANGLGGPPQWIPLAPGGTPPTGRFSGSLVFNTTANQALAFGGSNESIASGAAAFNDLWLLSNANGLGSPSQWTQIAAVGGPPLPRFYTSVGYSSTLDQMIVAMGRSDLGVFGNTYFLNDAWVLSAPLPIGAVGQTFAYQLKATDPDSGDVLAFSLDAAPLGMSIDSVTGLLQWTPTASQVGQNSVTVRVRDLGGLSDTQTFQITVMPVISSVSPNSGLPGQSVTVAITGQGTHFVQGVTTVNFGSGISVGGGIPGDFGTVTVTSPTSATAQVTISSLAPPGQQTVTAQTGSESAVLVDAFLVVVPTTGPTITTVSPNSGQQGQGGPVGIVGLNTHFVQGATQVSFGPGITVSNINVTCPTCLTAQLQISSTAAPGPVTVTVTTGSEVATLANGFTVLPGTPILTSMVPAGGRQGQNVTSTITGQFTHWAQGTTQVSLGAGIIVTSVTVSSATSLSVQLAIDPAAAVGTRTLTVTTGTEVVSAANVFTVQAATPILYSLNPGGGSQGQQNLSVVITGLATHFVQGTSVATFGAGVTVISLTVASATSATAIVNIDPAAVPGTRTVTVTTGSEVASFTNGFTITASGPIIYTLNPGGSSQGATNLQVQITGLNTHFVQGTSVVTFGVGITVTSLAVTNATTATATVNIGVAAMIGPRTVTVTTGTEVASFINGFTVVAGVSGITEINPGGGPQGIQNLSLAVTAQFTHFVQGTTTATVGAGVTVNSVTVTDSTHLTLSVSVSGTAATGNRTVTITTGTEVVSAPGGFVVSAAGAPTIVSVSPTGAMQGQQNVNVAITGQLTHFVQGTSTVSFGAGVTVNSVTVASSTSLTANISLALGAATGGRTVTVTTGTEIASLASAFAVLPAVNQAPVITIASTWTDTLPSRVTITYSVSDDGLPLGGALTVSWQTISGPGTVGYLDQTLTCVSCPAPGNPGPVNTTGSISVGFDQAGTYVLQIGATDTQLTTTQNVTVTVTGTPLPPPTVSITSPTDGTSITSLTNVVGSVASPSLASWTLEFHMQNESIFRPLATGTTAVTNGFLGTFDPTLQLNGFALIQLRATDTVGQTSIFGPISVVVTGNQKIGNFTVSFNDLTVPVAGLPIQVVRTYDSRNKTIGDFGVGWRLDLTTVTLAANGPLGDNWSGTNSGGLIPNYCIQPSTAKVVMITFADGTVFQFQPTLNPACQRLDPLSQTTVSFTPISTTPPNASLAIVGNNQPYVYGSFPGTVTLLDLDDVSIFNPDLYQLTMPDGRVLLISQHSGLQSMTDPNGNKLTVTAAGIIHSSGKSVTFQRDQFGRITQVTDPNGNTITYIYDPFSGDLDSVRDAAGNVTTFTYDGNHGLLTIVDPRGVQPIRNVYDSDGRLIQHIDAYGNVINYTNNLSAQQEIVTDRLGNVTVDYYDANGNIIQVTDALGGNTLRTYDANNNLLTETNPLHETRTYTYDANNNRLTETDPLSHTTTYTYNSRNQVLTITDALGRVTTNTYDANGNLTSTKDPLGDITTYTYNAAGLQISMTDPLGGVTSSQYDSAGDLTQQTDALGHITTYTYDANGNRLSQTKTRTGSSGLENLVTSYQYDALNRVIKTTYPDGSTTQIQYNPIGKQSVTTDQLGRQTSYQYDLMGRLTQTTYPDGAAESITYDAEGDRITSTDRAGRVTTFAYDPLKRLVKSTYADGATAKTTYDAASEVTAVTDARGNVTQYQYDNAGRRTAVIDGLTHTTSFTYDGAGNQVSMTDANGHTIQYHYDNSNRRTHVTYPDATTDSTAYDALGRTISKTDQAGKTTQFTYDPLGRLTQVTDAAGQLTRYAYDEIGDRVSQTDANAHTTSFVYDKLGRRTGRTLPLGMTESFAYDLASNQSSHQDFNGKTTTYAYDLVNRLTTKVPDASFAAPTVRFTYSATGQRLSMIDASGTTTYGYDLRDRLLQKATPEGTLTYTYDAAGDLLSILSANSGGTSVNYAYDALNRLAAVTDNRLASGTTSYTYDNAGNLQSYLYPNGVQSLYTYDPLNRLTNLALSKSAALATYAYTLGLAGNRTAVAELGGRQVTYTYDALYRLTGETIAGGTVNGAIGYTYDAVGNRLTRTSTVAPVPPATSTYDANDRLATDVYDANGNTTGSGANSYGYDFENHLIAQNGNGVAIVYDGDGNRVAKTVGGATTRYLVDDRNLTGYAQVLEELSGGTVQRVYTYGLNRISQSQSSGTSFYGYDGHGNVRILTDTTGAVTDRYDYDAFGNIISQAGSTPNVYLYSGEQNDPNLGFYYLRARYLSQSTGRFWTMDTDEGDPGEPISQHKYTYVGNEPVVRADPSGNQYDLVSLSLETADFEVLSSETTVHAGGLFTKVQALCDQCPLVAPSGNYTIQPDSPTPIHAVFAPDMAKALSAAFRTLNVRSITPMITDGFRTQAEQLDRYQNATYGAVPMGLHQIGLAVDINSNDRNFPAIKAAITAQGLTWGGTFSHPDPVHFQLGPPGTKPSPEQLAACEREHPFLP